MLFFRCRDESGDFLLEKIRDSAGQKGTGSNSKIFSCCFLKCAFLGFLRSFQYNPRFCVCGLSAFVNTPVNLV